MFAGVAGGPVPGPGLGLLHRVGEIVADRALGQVQLRGDVSGRLILLAPTLAWVVVALAAASRLFRWEPRRT